MSDTKQNNDQEPNKDVNLEKNQNQDQDHNDQGTSGDDKEKNFANLRRRLSDIEAENARLQAELEARSNTDRSLDISNSGDEPENKDTDKDKEGGDSPKEDIKDQPTTSDPAKVLFQRDMKEAVRGWTKKNQTSNEDWQQIKSKVSLKGNETQSEIEDKIQEAYDSLPSVRQRREEEITKKAKQEAMNQYYDDDMDFGGGSGDVDLGESKGSARVDRATANFAKRVGGMSDEEIKNVDHSQNPNEWTRGKEPKRSFFQG